MKFEFDSARLKETKTRLQEQIADNPLAAAAVGAATLNGAGALINAMTKRKNAKTARMNAKSWDREVSRRQNPKK